MKERLFIVKLLKKFLNLFLVVSCCFISVNVSAAPTQKSVKIVFVGDRSAGKTAFRNTLIGKQFDFDNKDTTERSDVYLQAVPYDNDTTLMCELWDTSGAPTIKEQVLSFRAKDANFVILTIDLSSKAESPYDDILKQNMARWTCDINQTCPGVHIIFLGTKSDLITSEESADVERKLGAWITLYDNTHFLLTSAKRNINIDRFFGIVKQVIREKNLLGSLSDWTHTRIATNESDDTQKSGGCTLL